MKRIILFGIVLILVSCSTSNDVVSNSFFQKRKYTKGWYFNKKVKITDQRNQEIVKSNGDENSLLISEKDDLTNEVLKIQSKTIDKLSSTKITSIKDVESNNKTNPIITSEVRQIDLYEKKNQTRSKSNLLVKPVLGNDKVKKEESENFTGANLILLVILAFFFSWWAVGIYTKWNKTKTIINLLIWLVGVGFFLGGLPSSIAGVFSLIALVHALLIILDIL